MGVLDKIKSFFKRPKLKAEAQQSEPAAKEKAPDAPEKKAGEGTTPRG